MRYRSMVDDRETTRGQWFGEQIEALLPDLYGAALRFEKNEADAQDLVAEAVAKAWLHLDALRDRDAFRGWMFRILTNCFRSRCRAERARGVAEPYEDEAEEPASFSLFERLHQPFLLWWGNPEREFLGRLVREDFERAVDDLPEALRAVVVLADLEGLAYRDIAETLGIPLGTVRSRLARGRSRLQQALWHHAADAGIAPDHQHRAEP